MPIAFLLAKKKREEVYEKLEHKGRKEV